jgi:ABC-type sugar transport system ATPase subunit
VQIGEPIEVYRNPVNTFDAGFLASPPMNLLPARLEDGQDLSVVHGSLRLPVPAEFASSYAAYKGKPVILGLRPEDMYAPVAPGLVPVDVTVAAVEALGPETVLVSEIPGGAEISSRLGREFSARIGSTQRLYVDPRQMHLFDPETTSAIPRNHAA